MDKTKQKAPAFLRLTLVPVWKSVFKSYCDTVKNTVLIDKATRKLQMERVAIFGLALIVWSYLFAIVGLGLLEIIKQAIAGNGAYGIAIGLYGFLVYTSYTALLNTIIPRQLV
jgi:hypothetical protein